MNDPFELGLFWAKYKSIFIFEQSYSFLEINNNFVRYCRTANLVNVEDICWSSIKEFTRNKKIIQFGDPVYE